MKPRFSAEAQSPQVCVTPPSGLKLWLPFDETTGALANDFAGFNNIGIYGSGAASPSQVAGKVAGALSFDGSSDYVEVAHDTEIDFLGDCANDVAEAFTIDAWIKTTASSGVQTILDKRANTGNPIGYHLFLNDGRLGLQLANGGTFTNFVAPGNPVADGNWHFIAVTVSRCRTASGKLYVDGNLAHNFTPIGGSYSNTANLNIGRRIPAFSANFFNGAIDELEIFKRVLADTELQSIYTAGSAGKCKPSCGPTGCVQPVFNNPVYYDPGALTPNKFAFGDFNGDGVNDLATINSDSNSASVLLGNSDGTFNTPPKAIVSVGTSPMAGVAGDFNKDGKLDLAVVIQSPANAVILLGNGDGTFQLTANSYSVGGSPASVVAFDYNADGNLDLAVANNVGVRLMTGAGNGTFTTGTQLTALANTQYVATGDFNQDGRLDLAAANLSAAQVSVLLANGSGGFNAAANFTVASGSNNIAVGDVNLDGKLDLAVAATFGNGASILIGNGAGGFGAPINLTNVANPVNAVAIGEFDGDGIPDLVVASSNSGTLSILKGNGDGTFGAKTNIGLAGTTSLILVGDFNQDGKDDIAANVPAGNRVAILLNNCIVNNPAVLAISPTSLPGGQVGASYSQMLSGSGGTAPYTFAVTAGSLPPGLTLGSDGSLTGAFTQSGAFTFTVTMTDSNGCTTSKQYTIEVLPCPTITVTPSSLPAGTVGVAYNQTFTASGGMAPYTFSLAIGSLPSGVTLNANGTLSGTPQQAGTYIFTVKATDKNGCMGTVQVQWRVLCPQITITPATLPNGTAGTSYGPVNLMANGGTAPYSFAVTGGTLPSMLTLTTGGQLSGVLMQTGSFTFTVTVTDAYGCKGEIVYKLNVDCGTISIQPAGPTLPDATINTSYNPAQTFTASGGCGQYTFSIAGGALPPGLSLNPTTGALSGTPTQVGTYSFTVKVVDKCGCMATRDYRLNVLCPTVNLINKQLFSTGMDNNGQPLPLNAQDPHYSMTPTFGSYVWPTTPPYVAPAVPGWWAPPNNSTSQWLSPFANWASSGGTFSYQISFNLSNCAANSVQIAGQWEADNQGQIFLNGNPVPGGVINNPGFLAFQNFTINSGFVAGLNTIEFRVVNLGSLTGLRVEFTSATARCCECVPPPGGMVGWWPLDEPNGATIVNDLIGGHHGAPKPGGSVGVNPPLGAPNAVTGAVAGAMHFITNSNYINVPHHTGLNFGAGNFTLDAWVRTGQASPSINKVIVEKLDQAQKRGYSFSIQGNKLVLTLGDGSPTLQTFTSAGAIAYGPWQHVAVSVDRGQPAQAVKFYVNGAADPPLALPGQFGGIDTTADLRIGGIETFIDEVELFNTVISQANIQAIQSAGPAGKCKPCVRPRVIQQPVSVKLCPGSNVTFTAAAQGSPYPVVQWQVSTDGGATWNNIPGANGTTLIVAASALQNGNKYRAVFTNDCGVSYSSPATVTIANGFPCAVYNWGADITRQGGNRSLSVVLPATPPFAAATSDNWITIDAVGTAAPATGAGLLGLTTQSSQTGVVNFTVAPNNGAAGRIGKIVIGGQDYAVVQGGENPVATVSAARYGTISSVSADSIVAAFGLGLATSLQEAVSTPLPTTLAGTQVKVKDAVGTERLAPLFFVSPEQINYLIPVGTVLGPAQVTVTAGNGKVSTGTVEITPIAPGVFTANASGQDVPAADVYLFFPDNTYTTLPSRQYDQALKKYVPVPLDFGAAGNRMFLALYGSGIKGRIDLSSVTARVGGIEAPVSFADAQGGYVGLDQVNIEIPRDLIGRGEVQVEVFVDGQTVNVVTISIK